MYSSPWSPKYPSGPLHIAIGMPGSPILSVAFAIAVPDSIAALSLNEPTSMDFHYDGK